MGNTSVFIALDYLVQFVRNHSLEEKVDVYSLVLNVRHNRPFMVHTEVCVLRGGGEGLFYFVGCLTSQQHASVSQGRICSDKF